VKPIYEMDGIQIWHGDCLEVLPLLEQVDHVITDPPYSEYTHSKQWIGAALTADGAPRVGTKFTELGFDALTTEMRDAFSAHARRLSARWVLAFSDIESISSWRGALEGVGLDYVRTCIWDKVDSAPQFTGDSPAAGCEAICVAHQPGRKKWNGGGRRNLFRHPVNGSAGGSKPHPSTKPLPLMRELIELFTDPGDLILDPFMGSGTTLRAAKDCGRRAIGIELNETYVQVAIDRLRQGVLSL
jgi:DNA modification methylase